MVLRKVDFVIAVPSTGMTAIAREGEPSLPSYLYLDSQSKIEVVRWTREPACALYFSTYANARLPISIAALSLLFGNRPAGAQTLLVVNQGDTNVSIVDPRLRSR